MKRFGAVVVASAMFLALICPSVMAAPRKVTKPAQNVEKSTEAAQSVKPKAAKNIKATTAPADKAKADTVVDKTGVAK